MNLNYGIVLEKIVKQGYYQDAGGTGTLPTCATTMGGVPFTGSGSGTNAMVTCGTNPSTVSFGTDNTAAFRNALGDTATTATMNYGSANATPVCIYIPSGNYLMYPVNQPSGPTGNGLAKGYGCWFGDEHNHSNIFIIPNVGGDLFAWIDAGQNKSLPDLGNTQTFSNISAGTQNQGGATFRSISIIGDRDSTAQQNGLMFYGKTDHAYLDDFQVSYVPGIGLGGGYLDTGSPGVGSFNESTVQNGRFEHDGLGTAVPAVEFTSYNIEGSNNLNLVNLRLYQSIGTGLWIHQGTMNPNAKASGDARGIRITNLKIEGSYVSSLSGTLGGDLLELGDPLTGAAPSPGNNVSNVFGRNIDLVNPPIGYAAVHITGALASDTSSIDLQGGITDGTGYGRGAQVDTGKQISLAFANNNSGDYNLQVGAQSGTSSCGTSAIGAPGIVYDAKAGEGALTTCIDPAAAGQVQYPARQILLATTLQNVNTSASVGQLAASITPYTGTTLTLGGNVPVSMNPTVWTVLRSLQNLPPMTPPAPFTDTWDNAANIVAALGPNVAVNQVYRTKICNVSTKLETLQSSTGVTSSPGTITAGSCVSFSATITALGATPSITISGI